MAIRVVCFDLGGVVVRIHRTWEQAARHHGVYRGLAPKWETPDGTQAWRALDLEYHRGTLTTAEYFEQVAALCDGFYAAAEFQSVHHACLIEEYTGMDELVDQLRERGIVTACLSNTNEGHWRQMTSRPAAFPVLSKLDVRLASHELGLLKPEEEIYQAALETLSVRPDEIVFFDDLPENVAGAQAGGWHAALINPERDPRSQMVPVLTRLGVELAS